VILRTPSAFLPGLVAPRGRDRGWWPDCH